VRFWHRVNRRVRRWWYGHRYTPAHWSREDRIGYLEEAVEYLHWQTTSQAALLRHLIGPEVNQLPAVRRTRASFDFQWADIPTGHSMLDNPEFRARAAGYVTQFTGLPAEWFKGKRVIDVGCGMGRYSWALSTLGAHVVSLDQSEHGLQRTREACKAYPEHRAIKIDLLGKLPDIEPADLVWSFGVLHHTGDTYRAFQNVVPLVKPGGYLYLMIYGEPRPHEREDFAELNEYERWRHRTANLDLTGKLAAIRRGMAAREFRVSGDEHVHGYFDAISPPINDLHSFEELEGWLLDSGFHNITRTVDARNIHVIAQRK
jgi:SAM-dependent methyltransferase